MKQASGFAAGALLVLGAVTGSTSAFAQAAPPSPYPPPPSGRPEIVYVPQTTPNLGLIASGAVLLGGTYVAGVIVAASSSLPADHHLYVPLAGPWIDYGNRPTCTFGCRGETANELLLISDGVLQAIGVIQIVGGFLFPRTRLVPAVVIAKTRVEIAPTSGGGRVGLSARAAF